MARKRTVLSRFAEHTHVEMVTTLTCSKCSLVLQFSGAKSLSRRAAMAAMCCGWSIGTLGPECDTCTIAIDEASATKGD